MPYQDLRKGRWSQIGQVYLLTLVTKDRRPWFAEFDCGRIAVREMRRLQSEGALNSLAFVVMPDHVHWLVELRETQSLSRSVQLFKGRVARELNRHLQRRGAVWQVAFYDRALRHDDDLRAAARYIVANPVRSGLVSKVGAYSLWDAIWL